MARFVPNFVAESRLWRFATHRYTRVGVRVARVAALGTGIYGAGYAYGVQASLDDPEGVGTSILKQVTLTTTLTITEAVATSILKQVALT